MSARSSQLRRQRDAYLERIGNLESELRKVRHSVFRKRNEIRLLIKQLEWKSDRTPDVARVKELRGLKTTLRSERYIKGVELERIKSALCDHPTCGHCRRIEAAMPDGGPFRSEPLAPTQQDQDNQSTGHLQRVEAERDQLEQHVEDLLAGIDKHRNEASPTSTPQKFSLDGELYAVAERVRKELGNG